MRKRLSLRDDEVETPVTPDEQALVASFETVLRELGEDPRREGLSKTPTRVARALRYLTSGYEQDPAVLLNGALFTENYNEMVLVKDIDFFSLCEHHLLPFFGKAHVAYIPDRKIVGLSKIARLVDLARRHPHFQFVKVETQPPGRYAAAAAGLTVLPSARLSVCAEAADPRHRTRRRVHSRAGGHADRLGAGGKGRRRGSTRMVGSGAA
jgi:hypothetical protein